jgi:hypothetical protein
MHSGTKVRKCGDTSPGMNSKTEEDTLPCSYAAMFTTISSTTHPNVTLTATNPTWTDPGTNPGLRGEKTVTTT